MSDSQTHLQNIRAQFTKQADAYTRMAQTTDEGGLAALVMLTGAGERHRVLDVACGPGFLTMAFARQCGAAVGVDATEEMLSRARAEVRRRGLDNVEFRAADAERLPFDDASFDIVSCRAAFHHFLRPQRVVAEMKRVARRDGRLLIADMLTSEDTSKALYHNNIERLCDPTHARALSASEFERLFADAGLRVVLRPQTLLHYDVDEWIEHGGPSEVIAQEIRGLLAASVETDRSGLSVRYENGRLRFSHAAAAFVLRPVEA